MDNSMQSKMLAETIAQAKDPALAYREMARASGDNCSAAASHYGSGVKVDKIKAATETLMREVFAESAKLLAMKRRLRELVALASSATLAVVLAMLVLNSACSPGSIEDAAQAPTVPVQVRQYEVLSRTGDMLVVRLYDAGGQVSGTLTADVGDLGALVANRQLPQTWSADLVGAGLDGHIEADAKLAHISGPAGLQALSLPGSSTRPDLSALGSVHRPHGLKSPLPLTVIGTAGGGFIRAPGRGNGLSMELCDELEWDCIDNVCEPLPTAQAEEICIAGCIAGYLICRALPDGTDGIPGI